MKPPSPRRRLLLTAGTWLVAPMATRAQPSGRVHRIAVLSVGSPSGRALGFEERLRELGYVEGQNLVIERRYAQGQYERLPRLAEELIAWRPDVFVAGTSVATRAAMAATRTIPIVFTGVSDPIDTQLVSNLARPGGNVTGQSFGYAEGFATKWLQLLQQTVPTIARAAALHDYAARNGSRIVKELQSAARALKLRVDTHYAGEVPDLDAALAAIAGGGTQGLLVAASPFLSRHRARLIQFAAERRLPTIFSDERFAAEGALMSYGPNQVEVSRRAGSQIDRIIKGAKPGDLPVEQPTHFDLVINTRTALALGIKFPQATLLSATKVIE